MATPTYQNWLARGERAVAPIASLMSVGALCFRCRHFLDSGRIWAEDGTVFLPAMVERRSLLFIYNGHLEGWANVVAWLASLVELEQAARVLTWVPLIAAASVPLLGLLLWRFGVLELRPLLVLLALSAALPEVVEPLGNAANLHFYALYFTWFVLLLPARFVWWPATLAFGCGLSGIPACMLLPAFASVAWRTREPEHLRRAGFLGLAALPQVVLLLMTGPGRELTGDLLTSLRAAAFHLVTVPLASTAADRLNQSAVPALAVALLAVLVGRVLLSRNPLAQLTLYSGLGVAFLGVFAPHGGGDIVDEFESVLGGARYFAAPSTLVLTALAMTRGRRPLPDRALSMALAAICLLQVGNGLFVTNSGPPWREALSRARSTGANRVEIWPAGWFMPLQR